MSNSDPRPELIEALTGLGVVGVGSLKAAFAATGAVFLKERRPLQMAHHFTFQPDVLVLDRALGTLGLVEILPPAGDLGTAVQERVDRATYVRHLLATDQKLKDRLPLAVELVLVAPRSGETLRAVGERLRTIARTTAYLHAIGVNELYHEEGSFDPDDLRRAFPWLLGETRKWYLELSKNKTRPGRTLRSLQLKNYRLPGDRTLQLETSGDVKAHLVHGHNGSGKSSFAEALELAFTGTIERLELGGESDYPSVLKNRDASGPASLKLEFTEGVPYERDLVCNPGETLPPNPGSRGAIKATGFRLDQTVMDRLARLGESLRLTTFLESFFPEDAGVYKDYRRLERERKEAFASLPSTLREAVQKAKAEKESFEDAAARLFGSLKEDGTGLTGEGAEALLPLPLATLRALLPLVSGLQSLISEWETSPPTAEQAPAFLDRLDRELNTSLATIRDELARLRTAWAALESLKGWQAGGQRILEEDPADVLNAWLELCALVDLADKQLQVAKSLADAKQRGWKPETVEGTDLLMRSLLSPEDIAALESRRGVWAQQRETREKQVGQLGSRATEGSRAPGAPVPQLDEPQVEALNAMGLRVLSSPEASATAPLGLLVSDALVQNATFSFGDIPIGGHEWVEQIQERLKPLLDACEEAVKAAPPGRIFQSAEPIRLLRTALKAHAAFQDISLRIKSTFLERIRPDSSDPSARLLRDTINELMALFTPTRWAYEDVSIAYQSPEASPADASPEPAGEQGRLLMTLRGRKANPEGETQGTAKADLLFNTAELNVFTVALFLLCSPRIENDLGLLVLDDPLQNMDELTVTTLARGLARVVRLLPEGWRLLMLFHGEDDLERFRREVPAAVYLLPWLTPAEPGVPHNSISIGPEPGRRSSELQKLDKLLRELPREDKPPSAAPAGRKARTGAEAPASNL